MKSSDKFESLDSFALLLIGAPGQGKTTTALNCFPKPYIADCDNNLVGSKRVLDARGKKFNYDTIQVDDAGNRVPPEKCWERLNACVQEAVKSPEVGTIIVDSISAVFDYLNAYVIHTQRRLDGKLQQQDWGTIRQDMIKFIMFCRSQKKPVVFIAHRKTDKDEITGILQYGILWSGSLKDDMGRFFTDIWGAQCEVKGGKPEYSVQTQSDARNSFKCSLDLPYKAILSEELMNKVLGVTPTGVTK